MTPLQARRYTSRPLPTYPQQIPVDSHTRQFEESSTLPTSLSSHAFSSSEMLRSFESLNPGWDVMPNRHPSELEQVTMDTTDDHPPRIYLYYRVYIEDGIIPSRSPIDSNNLYLGCIDANYITPPHTVASIKRCLSRFEFANHNQVHLFRSTLSRTPMHNNEHLAVLSGVGPGTSPKLPLALVKRSDGFRKPIKMTADWNYSDSPPSWLAYSKGDVLFTDGVTRTEVYNRNRYPAFLAQTAAGRIGLVAICLTTTLT